MTKRLGLLLFLLAAAFPARALAQNASTAGSLELYPTFEAIGLRLVYTGDANANATAQVEWRVAGDANWQTGVTMTHITNSRWAGSILWLTPGTHYEARVVIDDADGGATSATVATTTRSLLPATPTGRTWWVAPNGHDANAGTTGAPLLTIANAMSKVQPGDEIRVRPGVYYEAIATAKSGTATSPIHLTADGPGVILEGADPAQMHRTDWRDDGGGIFSIAYTPTANRLVCADSLMRLYKETSLANLQSNAHGLGQGFAIEGGRLSVKLEGGLNPNGHTMYIARYNVGLTMGSSNWHVSGFTIRHFGMAVNGSGIQLLTGAGSWIADNYIYAIGGRHIFMRLATSNNLIEHNHAMDPRIGTWPWSATKAHDEENPCISNRGGRGNVIRYNAVEGGFDGLDANDGQTSEDTAADADYYGNTVSGCGDDGIETDTVSGLNLRFWGNRFVGNYSCISLGPIIQGPEYVLYNTFVDYTRNGFKFALTSTGAGIIAHNTITSKNSGTTPIWPTGPWANCTFRNNILVGNGLGASNDDSGESQTGNTFDSDLLYSTGTSTLFRWKNNNHSTIAALRSATGFEALGKSGDPLFVSSFTGDYTLQAGSPAIDAAAVIPGITRGYSGAAPDIGANEYGAGADTIPPGKVTDLH